MNDKFEEMKSREVAAFNHNYQEIEKILNEVHEKFDSENRVKTLKELSDLKDLIIEYIRVVRNFDLIIERTHFGENKRLIDRNKEYYNKAIKSLKSDLKVVKGRIKKTEAPELDKVSPKEYKSLTRSRAFCIMIMYQNGKISDDIIESKEKIISLSKKEFPKQSGKTVYEALKLNGIYHNFEDQRIRHSLDYEYGLKLYKERFSD